MSRKGGYKIIDLKGLDFSSSMVIDGIHESIEDNYGKPLLFSGIVIDGVEKDDVFANVVVNGDGYDVTLYGQTLHISNTDVVSYKRNVVTINDATNKNFLKTLNNGTYRVSVNEGVDYESDKPIIIIGENENIDGVNNTDINTISFNTNVNDVGCLVLNECVVFGNIKDEL